MAVAYIRLGAVWPSLWNVKESCSLSCVQLFMTPWTIAHQAPLSMGFCRQEYWSGLPAPSQKSSQPKDRTQDSCISGRFFTVSAMGLQASLWKPGIKFFFFIFKVLGIQQFPVSLLLLFFSNQNWLRAPAATCFIKCSEVFCVDI